MIIVVKVFASFLLMMSMIFVLLPGGFGLMNFKRKHGAAASVVATAFYHGLWLAHVLVIYNLWAGVLGLWWPIMVLLAAVIIFFASVGKDVSASS